jgi:hypothetical protein
VVTDGEGTGFRMKTGNSIWDRFSLSAVRLQKADALLYFRPSRGVVAQLGERLGRIEEVVSSILIHSTRVSKPAHDGGFVCCRGCSRMPSTRLLRELYIIAEIVAEIVAEIPRELRRQT